MQAGTSFHVCGALRGRALARSMDTRAGHFLKQDQAELIAIDAYYRSAKQRDPGVRGRPVQGWLEDCVRTFATSIERGKK